MWRFLPPGNEGDECLNLYLYSWGPRGDARVVQRSTLPNLSLPLSIVRRSLHGQMMAFTYSGVVDRSYS